MRIPPRIALVPFAVLVCAVPFTFSAFVGPAGADTAAECEAAFSTSPAAGLSYSTDPPSRLAFTGQTVRLSGTWDPAAWDSLSSAVACVRVDDAFDDVLGVSETAPDNSGAFEHSFTIPEVAEGTRLCTRIRLTGDPVGETTDTVWVSKMHCFEVDHEVAEVPPSEDDTTTPTTSAPSSTTTTAATTSPAGSSSNPGGDSPAEETAQPPAPVPPAPPFDTAGDVPPPASGAPTPSTGTTPEMLPTLPATGYASLQLLRHGELLLLAGLVLLALARRLRRRQAAA